MHPHLLMINLAAGLLWVAPTLNAQSIEEFDRDDPPAEEAAPQPSASPALEEVEQGIVRRTNRFREKQGLEPVETDPQLEDAAQYFADYMARTEKYGHTADGQRPSERAAQHGYEYCIVSENIGYRYSSAGFETQELIRGFMKGWKTSPRHRENLLDPHVTEIGVAVAHSEDTGNYYAVQMFGRPRSAAIRFRVVNRAGEAVEYTLSTTGRGTERSFGLPPRVTRTHQRCRPSRLQFSFDDALSIAVEDNMSYMVDTNAAGELTVRKEPLAAEDTGDAAEE